MTDKAQQSAQVRPWGLIGVSIVVLLAVIGLAGVVLVVQNERVKSAAERGIEYDVAVEDVGDDLQVAVLDLRHYHRNIRFGGPSAVAISDYDQAYSTLLQEIDRLEGLGVEDLDIPQPDELREMATTYHDEFRPTISLFTAQPIAFRDASEIGLARIAELERATETINDVGERLTSQSLARVDNAAATERLVLISLLTGVALVGVALSIATGRIVRQLQLLNSQEQEARQQLAVALQTRTDFIADASHELRTPLTMIRGNAEIGIAKPGDPLHMQVLGEILSEASRMGRLVNDLLFLAQSDAGLPSIEREYLPVQWILDRIGSSADSLARSHSRCLNREMNGSGYLEVDPERIEQAVLIAIDNAAKHAPADSCIDVTATTRAGFFILEVADSGAGIAPDQIPMLFDRFYQVGSRRTRKKGGAGLGLAIARSIVEAHGGTINIESREGRGTRVIIRLPLSTEE